MESLLGLFDPSEDVVVRGGGRSGGVGVEALSRYKEDGQLPPEPQLGNVEYKLKLVNPSKTRFQHLVTQMKWRLREGGGEAIYEIGVEDSGLLAGLPENEMEASLKTLALMANELGATTAVLREREVGAGRSVTEVLVRKVPADQHTIEVRVAVLGSADAGKSTLVGVLTQGELDNGRGRARLNMFRHLHEVQSGRTSSISHEVLAFDSQGQVINCSELMTGEDVQCAKLVSLLDLAGHRKYLRTTVQALSGYRPQYAMLVVSSQAGVVSMTREHFSLLLALEVPVFLVITKTDLGPQSSSLDAVHSLLTTARRVPLVVSTEDDVLTAGSSQNSSVVPVFCVSSVTGRGLDLLTSFLHVLPPGVSHKEKQRLDQEVCEFQIDEVFRVVDVGTVVGGLLTKGVITEAMNLLIGPDSEGNWSEVKVESMHRNKAPCRVVHSTQSASLALTPLLPHVPVPPLRAGMLLVGPSDEKPTACIFFQATVSVLYHSTSIQKGFQMTVHVGNVRQTAVVEGIMSLHRMATNDCAPVLFRFLRHPECIRVGARLLFREGRTKGIGKVTQVFPYSSSAAA